MDKINNDIKTTVTGLLAVVSFFAGKYGFEFPDGVTEAISGILTAIAFYFTNKRDVGSA